MIFWPHEMWSGIKLLIKDTFFFISTTYYNDSLLSRSLREHMNYHLFYQEVLRNVPDLV